MVVGLISDTCVERVFILPSARAVKTKQIAKIWIHKPFWQYKVILISSVTISVVGGGGGDLKFKKIPSTQTFHENTSFK